MGDPGISERESLALWGLPLTEPAMETNQAGDTVLTQWFERARFEYHPDRPPEYRVLLGLLGREFWGGNARPKPSYQSVPAALGDQQPEPVVQTPLAQPEPTKPTASRPPTSRYGNALDQLAHALANSNIVDHTERHANTNHTPTPSMEVEATPTATHTSIPTWRTILPAIQSSSNVSIELVDMYHQQAGCPPLSGMSGWIRRRRDMPMTSQSHKRIDHVGTDGATLRERIGRTGYPYDRASEGIAVYKTPEIAVDFWMDEPPDGPHRMNITNCQYTDIGIGLAYDDRGWRWWVMDVANRRPGY